MQTTRLNVEALEVNSFVTTMENRVPRDVAPTGLCGSAVSETNGVFVCKTCGPCC